MDIIDKLRVVNQFIGYGDPKALVWLIGNEENLNDQSRWTDESLYNVRNITYKTDIDLDESVPTYKGYIKLLNCISEDLFKTNNYFVSNIWPIPKYGSAEPFDPESKIFFGFNEGDSDREILESIKEDRFDSLQMFFKTFKWEEKILLFCTRQTQMDLFKEFIEQLTFNPDFKFDEDQCKEISVHDKYRNIFWLYHGRKHNEFYTEEALEFLKVKIQSMKLNTKQI
jgi:hypothetical protein